MTKLGGAADYRMPAEWEPHEAVWLQWPDVTMRPTPDFARKLQSTWLEMTAVVSDKVTVRIIAVSDAAAEHIEADCAQFGARMPNVEFHVMPLDDVWARDNGPIFVKDRTGRLVITGWNFNGWGEDNAFEKDRRVPAQIARRLGLPCLDADIVTEGGAIEVNGSGSLMATRSSIMNANRNPGKDQGEIEAALSTLLGVEHFVWLSGAQPEICHSLGDGTDWHIDIAARFVDRNTVLTCWTEDDDDPRRPYLQQHLSELEAATDEAGRSLHIIKLPAPQVRSVNDVIWPNIRLAAGSHTDAAYSNYLVTNGLVLVPVYGQPQDETAKAIIAEHFPGREVVGIPTLTLTEEGGAIHCVTQQQPAAG
jgi:agmatine deiminase